MKKPRCKATLENLTNKVSWKRYSVYSVRDFTSCNTSTVCEPRGSEATCNDGNLPVILSPSLLPSALALPSFPVRSTAGLALGFNRTRRQDRIGSVSSFLAYLPLSHLQQPPRPLLPFILTTKILRSMPAAAPVQSTVSCCSIVHNVHTRHRIVS